MLLYDFLGNPFHPEYFHVKASSIGQSIFYGGEILFVNLIHVNIKT